MIAFAGNSLLCRLALKHTSIDAASFTFIRIFSGAAALLLIMKVRNAAWKVAGNWPSALALFAYAAAFSFAYNSLSAGTGALLLFGAVQATMILWGVRKGERLHVRQLVGLVLALGGLVVLLFPGLSAPPFDGFDPNVGSGSGLGHLFAARESRRRSGRRNHGQLSARRPFGRHGQYHPVPVSTSRSRRHRLCRAFRSDRVRCRLCNLVHRVAGLESSQRCNRSTKRAGSCGHRRDSLVRRTAHPSFFVRFHRCPGRDRARRDESVAGNPKIDPLANC